MSLMTHKAYQFASGNLVYNPLNFFVCLKYRLPFEQSQNTEEQIHINGTRKIRNSSRQ